MNTQWIWIVTVMSAVVAASSSPAMRAKEPEHRRVARAIAPTAVADNCCWCDNCKGRADFDFEPIFRPISEDGAEIGPAVVVAAGATIGSDAFIGAGSTIAAGAVIGSKATIDPDVVIEAGVVVGKDASIETKAVIQAGAVIGQGATVKQGVVVPIRDVVGAGEIRDA